MAHNEEPTGIHSASQRSASHHSTAYPSVSYRSAQRHERARHARAPQRRDIANALTKPGASAFPLRRYTTLPAIYMALTLACGLAMIFWDRNPARNDATPHWLRVRMLLRGQIFPVRNPADPSSDQWGAVIDGTFHAFNNTVINSPVAYWPSLLSGGNERAACILTLAVATLTTGAAMLLARDFQMLIAAAAILPMTFLSYIYPTADAMTNSLSFLFIGLLLYCMQQPRPTWVHWTALCAAAALLGQVKITCALLALLSFALIRRPGGRRPQAAAQSQQGVRQVPPHHRQVRQPMREASGHSIAARNLLTILPPLCALASSWAWNANFAAITSAPSKVSSAEYQELRHYALTHPLDTLKSIVVTMFAPLDASQERIDGELVNPRRNLQLFAGSEKTQLGPFTMVPLLFAVALLVLYTASIRRIRHAAALWLDAAICLAFFAMTCLAMLTSWAGAIGGYADGMQSRYCIPIAPLLFLLVPRLARFDRPRFTLAFIGALTAFGYAGLLIAHLIPWG